MRPTRSLVKIGVDSFSEQELVENGLAAIQSVVDHLPDGFDGWNGIQAIYLTVVEKSIVLPIYISLPQLSKKQMINAVFNEKKNLTQQILYTAKKRKNALKLKLRRRAKRSAAKFSPDEAKKESQAQNEESVVPKNKKQPPSQAQNEESVVPKTKKQPPKQTKEVQSTKKISEFVPPSKDLLRSEDKTEQPTKEKAQPTKRNKFKKTSLSEHIASGANVYSKLAPREQPKKKPKKKLEEGQKK